MKQSLRILLIEDNAGDVRLLRETLEEESRGPYTLVHFFRMNDAVAYLKTNGVDLVLLDLGLPDAHGINSIRRLVAAAPDIALIVLTGLEDDALAARAMKEGAQDYLIKGRLDDLSLWQVFQFAIELHRQQVKERDRTHELITEKLADPSDTGLDLGRLLENMSATLHNVVTHDRLGIALLERNKDQLRLHSLEKDGNSSQQDVIVPLHNSPAERALRTRQSIIVDHLEAIEFSQSAIQHLIERNIRSGCWAPLIGQHASFGCLMIGSKSELAFTQYDCRVLDQIARQISTALENAYLAHTSQAEPEPDADQDEAEEIPTLRNRFEEIVGESAEIRSVLQNVETVAPTDATVLIQGETGTGKELLARAIHQLSIRRNATFVKLNCAAIPSGLMESELFGHEKGAFTGAITTKKGRVELADRGTLFLDEVGELPLDLQPKLLRALQEREIERLGGNRTIPVNIRLIAATNRDLAQMVAQREFRSDLYYRLKVFPILAPSLRERRSDIPALVRHFVAKYSEKLGKTITHIQPDAMDALVKWAWPGNIRELENFIERAVILTRGNTLHVILAELDSPDTEDRDSFTLEEAEREHIVHALRESGGLIGGQNGAAQRLALKRTTLHSKIKKLGISRNEYLM